MHKVIEAPSDSANVPDGATLSMFQYFENVRNYLLAVEEMGLSTFEASDLEQGGKSARVVNYVLALKAYSDWKQSGGIESFKYGSRRDTLALRKAGEACDAKSEVLESDIDKKCNSSSGKRVRSETNGEDSPSLDWKKKKNLVSSPDDELVSMVDDSE